jgi:lipopolysaccharide export system permease protein
MKIIDSYLIKEFLYTLIGVLLICAIILLVYMIIESYEEILENRPGFYYTLTYFANSLPLKLTEVVPLAVAISVLFTVGTFAKNNEILALSFSGLSTLRIATPLLCTGAVISVLTIYFNEAVVPGCEERARYIEQAYIKGKGEKIITKSKDIFVKGDGQRFYMMRGFDSRNNIMIQPTILDVNTTGSALVQRIDAEKAELESGQGSQRSWRFFGATKWKYDARGQVEKMEVFQKPVEIPMEEGLEKFLSNPKMPEEMNFTELRNYIQVLGRRGESVNYYKTNLYLRLAFPFASFIIIVIGFACAVKAQTSTIVMGFGLGVLFTIGYYALTAFCRAMGHNLVLAPLIAGWAPNIVFLAIGSYLLYKSA